jgi:hypothetical protein
MKGRSMVDLRAAQMADSTAGPSAEMKDKSWAALMENLMAASTAAETVA